MKNIFVYSFYRFKTINNTGQVKIILNNFLKDKQIRGTILVANEGINGTISGSKKDLNALIKLLKFIIKIRILEIKINKTSFIPFNRMKVRIKNEIVSLGQGPIDVKKHRGKLVNPENWNSIIRDKNTKVIDVRNEFEIGIGNFDGSINPKTKSFREFPNSIKKMKIQKNSKIAMYCTGGIRCEKASAYLRLAGYKNIFQLNGGIIKYLEYIHDNETKKSLWNGECFVFDERVTINKNLRKGKYLQCYGCRRPITKKDTLSSEYKKGVYCPYCFNERSTEQKNRSLSRQKQIDINAEHMRFLSKKI